MTLGDALTLLGLAIAVLLYVLGRAWERRREIEAAYALLRAVRTGMESDSGWGSVFFNANWVGDALEERAKEDYHAVMKFGFNQVFESKASTSPLEALTLAPGSGDLIDGKTIETAYAALHQIGIFNQLVGQQTDLWARHLAEIADQCLPEPRREAIAKAACAQSRMLHGSGIGAANADGGWYRRLLEAVDENLARLEGQMTVKRPWWLRLAVAFAAGIVALAVVLAIWQAVDSDEEPARSPTSRTTTAP